MKNKILLALALLIGILAFLLNAKYLKNERDKLYAGAVKIQVLAATRDLPAGTVLQTEGPKADVGMISVYKSSVGDNVLMPSDFKRLQGKKLKYSLKRKEPIWWSHVDMPRDYGQGLSSAINHEPLKYPKGFRALSIPISGASAVSGMIKPGDYVDILGTFTMPSKTNPQLTENVTTTLFPKVKVLAVGNQLGTDSATTSRQGYSTITFEVEPEVAEVLVFSQQTGQLYLTLRHPRNTDTTVPATRINFDTIESLIPEINASRKFDN
jgi:Flp pilus assembly protein CpaB